MIDFIFFTELTMFVDKYRLKEDVDHWISIIHMNSEEKESNITTPNALIFQE